MVQNRLTYIQFTLVQNVEMLAGVSVEGMKTILASSRSFVDVLAVSMVPLGRNVRFTAVGIWLFNIK